MPLLLRQHCSLPAAALFDASPCGRRSLQLQSSVVVDTEGTKMEPSSPPLYSQIEAIASSPSCRRCRRRRFFLSLGLTNNPFSPFLLVGPLSPRARPDRRPCPPPRRGAHGMARRREDHHPHALARGGREGEERARQREREEGAAEGAADH